MIGSESTSGCDDYFPSRSTASHSCAATSSRRFSKAKYS